VSRSPSAVAPREGTLTPPPNKRLKLAVRLGLWNDSFFSAPQLERDPLGGSGYELLATDCVFFTTDRKGHPRSRSWAAVEYRLSLEAIDRDRLNWCKGPRLVDVNPHSSVIAGISLEWSEIRDHVLTKPSAARVAMTIVAQDHCHLGRIRLTKVAGDCEPELMRSAATTGIA
jgi:hypothetical protein